MRLPSFGGTSAEKSPRPATASADDTVSRGMKIAGAWGWRILVVLACLAALVWLIETLSEIVVPFLIALLISALLKPFVTGLVHRRWPKWIAIVAVLLAAIVVFGGLILLVVLEVRSGLPALEKETTSRIKVIQDFLAGPPFNLTTSDYTKYINDAVKALQSSSSKLLSGALTGAVTGVHLLADALLCVFATIFMLIDGDGVWKWVVRLFPKRARGAVDGAGQSGWITLTTFVRVQIFVAAVDGLGVGLVAFFLGLPLAVPIGVLVFLASFIPVVGAIVSGVFAVVIALVFVGPIQAIIMLAGVLGVHLLEAHVLQPLVMGNAVKVHPLAVVFAVAGGSYVAGIPGALFAVPTIAVLNVMISYVARGDWRGKPLAPELGSGPSNSKEAGEERAAEEVVPETGHAPQ
ncbi:AI-2E family transporter [Frondihabitans australicus]|uniref:Putative PurR-regulated permease PerM n=1 Tax=Frondihabitans australicus TaxID=386892 RepID=A0A495IJ36_9MICO|nr:AI-2E family transporter [Frondihabitans australicus]RKR75993.1 putative PurR-regulated permease PerM [Frondihabitans australicus]